MKFFASFLLIGLALAKDERVDKKINGKKGKGKTLVSPLSMDLSESAVDMLRNNSENTRTYMYNLTLIYYFLRFL